jgi:hypothetical protein
VRTKSRNDPRTFDLRVDADEQGASRDCAAHDRYRESIQEESAQLRASSPEPNEPIDAHHML